MLTREILSLPGVGMKCARALALNNLCTMFRIVCNFGADRRYAARLFKIE